MPDPGSRPVLARASLVVLGLAWVVPFLQPYHRYPLTGFYSEWLAFVLGLSAALFLLRKEAWRDATVPLVALAPVGLVALLGLQVAMGRVPYPEQAFTAVLYLLWAMLLMQLAHVLHRELGMVAVAEALAWCTLAGGVCAALAGLLQVYEFSTPFDFMIARRGASGVVYGNLGQPNHYAAYLTLALACAGYLHGRGKLPGAYAASCAALLLLLLALSGSRSTWLYLGALAVLAVSLQRRHPDARGRRLAVFALGLLPASILAQWVVTLELLRPETGTVVTALERMFQSAGGMEARLQLWSEAWRMFLDAPVLGAGFGQFAWHHYVWSPPLDAAAAPGVYNNAHNIVLQHLAESGLAGAVIVVGAAFYWLAGQRRIAYNLERWWLFAMLAVIGIHSCLEYPLWYAYFLGVASVLLGLGATQVRALRLARAGRALAIAALALGWFNVVAIVVPYRDFERLVFEPRRLPADEPAYAEAIVRLHGEPLLTPYVELALSFGIAVSGQDMREKLELNTRVMRFAPIDTVVYRQALLLALAGERAPALRELDHAARAYPRELDDVVVQLRELAARQPGEFLPLLELAAARSAELRTRGGAR